MNRGKKAVALILFNRPDLISAVLAPVRKYAPHRIYLIADGPRTERSGEETLCDAARNMAIRSVDWPCEIIRLFSETNLGCRERVVSGLDAVFLRENDAIILEDDTVASDDFLPYCERMLDAHSENERIFSITGTKLFSRLGQQDSAFLSIFTHIWGWGTWRRSWLKYDRDLRCLGGGRLESKMKGRLSSRHLRHWLCVFNKVRTGRINTWDYQLQASAWMANACCLTPPRNLVSNRGFRSDATHTVKPGIFADMSVYPLLNSDVTYSDISPIYEWLFQNMFHNPSRPLGWLRSCLARSAFRPKASSQASATLDWGAT
jgi:hypothetical protein